MSKFIGRRVNVGIGKETSRGVGVAAQYAIPKTNITVDDKADKARSGEALGNISGMGNQSIVTARFAEGALEGEVNVNSFGLLMLALFGAETVSTVLAAQKHTYTLSNTNQHQSLSIHVDDPIGDMLFKLSMIDSLELTITKDDIVKFNTAFKCKKGTDDSYSASFATDYKFVGRDLVFKVAANTGALAAATAVSLKELKITISKNTDFDFILGTLEPEDILNKNITIQGSLTLNYEDRTWRDYMLNGDYKAVGIQLLNSRQTIGTNNPTFYLELPIVDFSEWESQRGNDEIAGQTLNFNALFDITNNKLISDAYIVNNVAAY